MLHAVAPLTWPQSMSNWVIWIATMVAIVAAFQRSGSVPFTLLGLATALFGYGIDGRLYIPLTVLAVGVLMRAVSKRTAVDLGSRQIVREGLLVALGFGLRRKHRA